MGIKRNNQLFKKILAIFLSILMIATTIPLNVFASSNMNLGEKDNNSTISVRKEQTLQAIRFRWQQIRNLRKMLKLLL